MNTIRTIAIVGAVAAISWVAKAADFTPAGDCSAPGGKLRMEVGTDAGGHLAWRLEAAGRPVIGASHAGVLVAGVDSGAGATVGKPVVRDIDQRFAWRGPDKERREHCRVGEPINRRHALAGGEAHHAGRG
jgi:hypothetical protein